MCSGSAADRKSGFAERARRMVSPTWRATGLSTASCWLALTRAPWWPAVALPSIHSAASRARRASATCWGVRTLGISRSTLKLVFGAEQERARVAEVGAVGIVVDGAGVGLVGEVG